VKFACERRGEVETEPVDVHLSDPVAKRVHDQLQRVRVAHVQAVAGACRVVVELRLVSHDAVVGTVIDALEAQRRTQVVAFGRVVVDHIKDYLHPGLVKGPHHGLELVDLLTTLTGAGVLVVGREEPDRVVAPVVLQPSVDQALVVNELMDRHQLHRGHAKREKVLDHRRMRESGVCAAECVRHLGMPLGQSLQVCLVDHGFV